MRDDIIERCALAIIATKGYSKSECEKVYRTTKPIWDKYARAVLTAFKEATADPTPGMIEAVRQSLLVSDSAQDWQITSLIKAINTAKYSEIGI